MKPATDYYMHKLTLLDEIQLELLLKLLEEGFQLLAAQIGHQLLVLLLLVDEHVPLVLLQLLRIGRLLLLLLLLLDELLPEQLLHVLLQRQSLAQQQRVDGCCCRRCDRGGGAGDVTGGLQRSDWFLLATCYLPTQLGLLHVDTPSLLPPASIPPTPPPLPPHQTDKHPDSFAYLNSRNVTECLVKNLR